MAGKRRLGKYGLRYFALGYLALLLLIPISMVVVNTFGEGIGNAWSSITSPDGLHAAAIARRIAPDCGTVFRRRRRDVASRGGRVCD